MKQHKENKENEAHAKEEASNWKNEEKAKQIIELFESGLKLREIEILSFQTGPRI